MTEDLSPAERYAAARRRAAEQATALAPFREMYDFGLDPFQIEACQALEAGKGVLVAAPTGSGKTIVGEFAVHLALQQGRKCFYTTPIKALSNQKYADLRQALRRRQGRPAHRRQQRQLRRPGGRHDHRGAAEHAVRGLADPPRPRLRGDGRGALPLRPLPRRRLGGSDHPPPGVGHPGLAVGDRVQRRGVRRLAGHRARRHRGDRLRAPARAAVPARARRAADVRPVRGGRGPASKAVNPDLTRLARMEASRPSYQDRRRGRAMREADRERERRQRSRIWTPSRPEVIERLDAEGLLPAITFIFSRAACEAAVQQCLYAGLRLNDDEARAPGPRDSSRSAPPPSPTRTCTSSATTSGWRAWSAASPPTTRACCRPSRRSSRSCSSAAWSRPSSPPRPWRWASTCPPAPWCWRSSSSGTASSTPTSPPASTPS